VGPLTLPGYGMNHNDEFWFSWSPQRKFRFARTMVVLFIVVALLARCALGGDGGEGGSDGASTTTTPTASTTTLSPTPTSVGAVDVATKLPAARYISSVARAGDKVMIVAGLDEKKNSTDTIWLFDPEAGTIADVGKFGSGSCRRGGAAGRSRPHHGRGQGRFGLQHGVRGGCRRQR